MSTGVEDVDVDVDVVDGDGDAMLTVLMLVGAILFAFVVHRVVSA